MFINMGNKPTILHSKDFWLCLIRTLLSPIIVLSISID